MFFPIASATTEPTVILITCVIFLLLFVVAGIAGILKQKKS